MSEIAIYILGVAIIFSLALIGLIYTAAWLIDLVWREK